MPEPVRPRPPLALTLGPGYLASSLGGNFTANLGADFPVSRYAWLSLFVQVPVTSKELVRTFPLAPALSSNVYAGITGLGATLPLMDANGTFVPRIGGGWGIAWLHVRPNTVAEQDPSALATGARPLVANESQDLLSPCIYGSVGASYRVSGAWRVSVEGLGGLNVGEFVVRYARAPVAYWGWPFGSVAIRAEVGL